MLKIATRAVIAVAAASILGGAFPGNSAAGPEPRDPTEIWPEDVSINFNALPCVAGGPTALDAANASTLNPQLHNKMRGNMTPYNSSCARAVVTAVKNRGLNERAAAIAISTVIVETSIANLDGGDLDSVGLFQQRNSWGSFAERTNPEIATNKFLNVMQSFYPNGSWNTAPIGDVAADVQRPAAQYRFRYGVEANDAITIANLLWNQSGTPVPPVPPAPIEDVNDARVEVDFNGDGKDDVGLFYAYPDGTVGLHMFYSTGSGITGGLVWRSQGNDWDWNRVKLTAGDYNGDGKGDIAAFYNYPDGTVGLQEFLSTGSGITGTVPWHSQGGDWDWNRMKITSGDVNADGKDDFGIFYAYPDGTMGLHYFYSTATGITGGLVWHSQGNDWDWNRIKPTTGDVNADGKDDFGIFYAYPDGTVGLHFFYSTGSGITGGLVWQSQGNDWDFNRIKVTSGDFNADGKTDFGILYAYPSGVTGLHFFYSTGTGITGGLVWQSQGNDWDWNRVKLTSGDFNADGKTDVAPLYAYPSGVTGLHFFYSTGTGITGGLVWQSQGNDWDWNRVKLG